MTFRQWNALGIYADYLCLDKAASWQACVVPETAHWPIPLSTFWHYLAIVAFCRGDGEPYKLVYPR